MKQEKLQKREVSAYSRGKLLALKWKDKKDVSLLSSIHGAHMVDVEAKTGSVSKPKVAIDYNNTMGGVDGVDQHYSVYPTPRKRGKNTTKRFFCLSLIWQSGTLLFYTLSLVELNHYFLTA